VTGEAEFAEALARGLGPLYRTSVVDGDGTTIASFGRIEDGRVIDEIPLPNSTCRLMLEMDARSLEAADRVFHALAAPLQLTASPLGALTHLDDALAQLLEQGEALVGKPLREMTRAEKRQLVHYLDERGAFTLRKAVERVAETLGVSRFTVYNYLDSVRGS
jgi:hypothetical protein